METARRSEITKAVLGYDLRFKITNELMESYLTPTYFDLRRRFP
ncbi:MAG TPA: hypothetical protein VMS18_20310 [Candidatus Binatia bacterium]|nr:hypothetical protein [Candidatus Binatia bacterium]